MSEPSNMMIQLGRDIYEATENCSDDDVIRMLDAAWKKEQIARDKLLAEWLGKRCPDPSFWRTYRKDWFKGLLADFRKQEEKLC